MISIEEAIRRKRKQLEEIGQQITTLELALKIMNQEPEAEILLPGKSDNSSPVRQWP